MHTYNEITNTSMNVFLGENDTVYFSEQINHAGSMWVFGIAFGSTRVSVFGTKEQLLQALKNIKEAVDNVSDTVPNS